MASIEMTLSLLRPSHLLTIWTDGNSTALYHILLLYAIIASVPLEQHAGFPLLRLILRLPRWSPGELDMIGVPLTVRAHYCRTNASACTAVSGVVRGHTDSLLPVECLAP